MGNRYNHHLHHNQNLHNNTAYLPIMCSRPSIKDVHVSKWQDRSTTSSSSSSCSSSSKDPSSPKVSCVGQVKIRNNKATIIAYPTPTRLTTTTTKDDHNLTPNMPILCSRPSIKDVHLSKWHDRSTTSSSPCSSSSKDPSSPKVSFLGQVKIRNNKATTIAYPTPTRHTTTTTTKDNHNLTPYSKLKRLFATKNLSTTSTTTTSTSSTSVSCRREMMIMGSPRRRSKCRDERRTNNNYVHPVVDVAEMDPPLPVVKRVQQPGEGRDEVNLWKRRSATAHGVALKSLKIQQIHIPNNNFLQQTPV